MNNIQKIYVITGIMIIIIILMIGFLVKPLINEVKQTSILISEENQKLLIVQNADIDYLKKIENDYKRIKDGIAPFKVYLNDDKTIDYIKEMEFAVNNISSYLDIRSANFPIFNLSLNGNFPNLMKFLGWLENSQYLVSVESMQIRKLNERDLISNDLKVFSVGDVNAILQIKLPVENYESK
ncbi:MAG: hypothetical protein Q8N88_05620 [Nanoarchaeota archaeon]|nr:hypothetical protein [Nanoarchaeota archaeon]